MQEKRENEVISTTLLPSYQLMHNASVNRASREIDNSNVSILKIRMVEVVLYYAPKYFPRRPSFLVMDVALPSREGEGGRGSVVQGLLCGYRNARFWPSGRSEIATISDSGSCANNNAPNASTACSFCWRQKIDRKESAGQGRTKSISEWVVRRNRQIPSLEYNCVRTQKPAKDKVFHHLCRVQ